MVFFHPSFNELGLESGMWGIFWNYSGRLIIFRWTKWSSVWKVLSRCSQEVVIFVMYTRCGPKVLVFCFYKQSSMGHELSVPYRLSWSSLAYFLSVQLCNYSCATVLDFPPLWEPLLNACIWVFVDFCSQVWSECLTLEALVDPAVGSSLIPHPPPPGQPRV